MFSILRKKRILLLVVTVWSSGLAHSSGLADGDVGRPMNDCSSSGDIVYMSGLILQGADNRFYLWKAEPVCVLFEDAGSEGEYVSTQLIDLQCYDDSWNGHERRRGETIEFRGEIGAREPDRIVLSCHMPL